MADDEKNVCERSIKIAMDIAEEECGSTEELLKHAGKMMGLPSNGVEPDEDCEAALEEGLNRETCQDFEGLRQWVLCKTWRLVEDDGMSFEEAIEEAWNMAEDKCENI